MAVVFDGDAVVAATNNNVQRNNIRNNNIVNNQSKFHTNFSDLFYEPFHECKDISIILSDHENVTIAERSHERAH